MARWQHSPLVAQMARIYQYVGPDDIRERAATAPAGFPVRSAADVRAWAADTGQQPDRRGLIAVTFVVDEQGSLRVADRRSEHIACAGGGPVLSAGEMFIRLSAAGAQVVEVTNQSTGYCPEPESWPAVASALDAIGVPHPGRFTQEVVFRRCPVCGERNVVKDGWFICGLCGADLPEKWNL
jgi:hypothetical protein